MKKTHNIGGFFLGVDVGSSKTHALITDCTGKALGIGVTGSGNHEVVGLDGFKQAMQSAIQCALGQAKVSCQNILGMGLGIAGYDWPSEDAMMCDVINALGIGCPYLFTNDVLLGLLAGSSDSWGVAVDAGAGNNVRGQDKTGRIGRITGESVYFGEIGGGGEIVWLAQIAVTHAWTQRGPKTALTQALIAFTETDSEFSLIQGLATGQYHLPLEIAEIVFKVAKAGDPVAVEIVNTSAIELALNVNAVIRQLGIKKQSFDIILIGSIFQAGDIYLNPFTETVLSIAPHAKLKQLTVPPVAGSIILAARAAGINPEIIKKNVISTIGNFLPGYDQMSVTKK